MNLHVRSDSDVGCNPNRTVEWGPGRDGIPMIGGSWWGGCMVSGKELR